MAPAHADEANDFIQITCAPELHYFSARVVRIWNLPKNGRYYDKGLTSSPQSDRRIGLRDGLYTAKSLTLNPNLCNIPRAPLIQGWDNGRPAINVRLRGRASGRNLANTFTGVIDVITRGKTVAQFDLGHKPQSDITSVEIKADGVAVVLRVCRGDASGESAFGGDKIQCSLSRLYDR